MKRLIRTSLVAVLGLSFVSVAACAEQPAPRKKKKKHDEGDAKEGDAKKADAKKADAKKADGDE